MRIGVSLSTFAASAQTTNVVDEAVRLGRQAAQLGLDAVWFGQMASYDAVAVAAAVGREVTELAVGTSVVPIYPRHPQLLASAAKTAQASTGGRFQLGVGVGAPSLLEPAYGIPFPAPITHLREYLSALVPLLAGASTPFRGETLVSRPFGPTAVAGARPPIPVIVAAMGPQALRVTGELADGTLPFLAGPRTLAEHIVPTITEAAARAGRPAPRIIAAVPAVVTHDTGRARAVAAEQMAFYDRVPSYQAVVAREGLATAAELLVAGDEDTVAAQLRRYTDAGATEVTLAQTDLTGDGDRLRTWRLAGELARA
ncbi:MAG TPA: TIGR03564 family F420-dependent LLM class oxidoreductase [Pseudonocardia sp.]|jgi:F420-dependent oxidoreductase-like protein